MRVNKGNFSFHETSFATCINFFSIFSYIRYVLWNICTVRSIQGYLSVFIFVVLGQNQAKTAFFWRFLGHTQLDIHTQ